MNNFHTLSLFFLILALIFEQQFAHSVPIIEKRQTNLRLIKKNAALTYYWVVFESDYPGPRNVQLKSCSRKNIAVVNARFAKDIQLEGTGILKDGRVVNIGSDDNCFDVIDNKKFPFGSGETSLPLDPFITIASNDIKSGTKLYIKEFDGLRLPINNKIHNGCFKVGDTGFSFRGNHIDVFVLKEAFYKNIDPKIRVNKVNVFTANCELLNYGPFK